MDTTAGKDDNDLPFGNLSDTISGGIMISIIAIVAVFGLPVFILFVIFFFRYKNRKARYRLAEDVYKRQDFLDGLVSKVYEFGNQKVTEHLCGIYEFLEKKKMDSLQDNFNQVKVRIKC